MRAEPALLTPGSQSTSCRSTPMCRWRGRLGSHATKEDHGLAVTVVDRGRVGERRRGYGGETVDHVNAIGAGRASATGAARAAGPAPARPAIRSRAGIRRRQRRSSRGTVISSVKRKNVERATGVEPA